MNLPKIGFTLGDPGGVGPEIVFDAIVKNLSNNQFISVVYGPKSLLDNVLWSPLVSLMRINLCKDLTYAQEGCINFVDCGEYKGEIVRNACAKNGQISFECILKAVSDAKATLLEAIVTGPICKESFLLAGLDFTGHTTLLKGLTESENVSMGFYTERLKTVLATVHIPLSEVPKAITQTCLDNAFENCLNFSSNLNIKDPVIAVAALNPHASEKGMFGHEERTIIKPTIVKWNNNGHRIFGPIPADTLYHRAYKGEFDFVISLYHDQGLIPIKLLNFHDAVNVTLGLPFIRTSPDHGTAFDISYQGKANSGSLQAALKLALKLSNVVCHTS
ncbi:4-hydroxythreonine-4-phosphate dehydrogenase PdxA [Candidatus Marinamargulisbacteria bacterium SCGC AAA071-K20]|nr:4-hydroxythreonine-4-phosphate dehydrogenase PdxA [Candidatus Marinamargulisbacteria bacterium SCGC AAA071-K20]